MDELSFWLNNSPDPTREQDESEVKGPPQHFASSSVFALGVRPTGYRPQHRKVSPLSGQIHEFQSLAGEKARGFAEDVKACGVDLAELASVRLPKVSHPVLVATSVAAALSVATIATAMSGGTGPDTSTQLAADRSTEVAASRSGDLPVPSADASTTTTAAPTTTTTILRATTTTTKAPATTTTTSTTTPKPKDNGPVGDDVWQKLANCEAGGRNDTGAPYYGYFQFSPTTWKSVGGTGLPSDHDYGTQKAFAKKLQERSGWGQWPSCSSKLGLR